ncbi:MAG: hypothetical protein ABI904_08115 [Chloroflexota bacterium]
MKREFREQIYMELDLRETDDLVDIWQTNDRVEWSDIAFEIIKEILNKRIGEVPTQNEPILEHEEIIQEDDKLEDWETNLLDDEEQPEFYDVLNILKLKDNINKVASAVIVIYVFLGLLNLQFVRMLFQGTVLSLSGIVQTVPNILVTLFSTGLSIIVSYYPLKALAQILRILMEIEFNSRKVK